MATLSGTTTGGTKYLTPTDPPDLSGVTQYQAQTIDGLAALVAQLQTAVQSSGANVAWRRWQSLNAGSYVFTADSVATQAYRWGGWTDDPLVTSSMATAAGVSMSSTGELTFATPGLWRVHATWRLGTVAMYVGLRARGRVLYRANLAAGSTVEVDVTVPIATAGSTAAIITSGNVDGNVFSRGADDLALPGNGIPAITVARLGGFTA